MEPTSGFREQLLDRIVKTVATQYPAKLPGRLDLLKLHAAWGNIGFMASLGYLRKISNAVHLTQGPILECGSGLTTLIMGLLTRDRRIPVFALEHHETWQKRMESVIKRYGLDHVTIVKAPLKDFGEYDWYDFDKSILPRQIKLVVCDGPPGGIKGSRYGLVPEMDDYLSNCCTILLDDANRKNEKWVMENWKSRHGFNYQLIGGFQKFAQVNRAIK